MPILVDPNSTAERRISTEEYAALVERDGRGFRRNDDEEVKLKLWDTITEDWGKPVPGYMGLPLMLRMLTNRCSDCTWTTNTANAQQDFQQHVQSIRSGYETHRKAVAMPTITSSGTAIRCSGCSATYMSTGRCQMHIDAIQRQGGGHEKAHMLLVKRYALEPSVPAGTPIPKGPMASQVQQPQVLRPRRRRHRNRRSSHVNAS